jgi:hypothetical protein
LTPIADPFVFPFMKKAILVISLLGLALCSFAFAQTVTITASTPNAAEPGTNDAIFEATETVIGTISTSANYAVGSPSTATVNIADDETAGGGPTVTLFSNDPPRARPVLTPQPSPSPAAAARPLRSRFSSPTLAMH